MKKNTRSLRILVLVGSFLIGIIPLILMHIIVQNTFESRLVSARQIDILQRGNMLTTEIGNSPNLEEALTSERMDTLNWYSEAYSGRLLLVDDNYKIVFDTYSADTGKVCISDAVFTAFSGNVTNTYDSDTRFLTFVQPITHVEQDMTRVIGVLILSASTEWMSSAIENLNLGMILVETIFIVVLGFLAFYLSFFVIAPIDKTAKEVEKIRVGNIDREITSIHSYREVDRIMDAMSGVIKRYQALEKSQEEFVSNVSHELRTPMTSIRVLSDSLIGQENVPEEIYQEFLTDISVEIDRESRIIDDLLSMARLGKASDAMNISTVLINDFVMDIMHSVRPIAQKRGIELTYESYRQVTADIDEMKLKQAFTNLIENAVKYNNDGGWVNVSLDADHEFFYLKVSDNGVGIPEDAVEHVFDRFYRVDKARSRDTGGTGLGLSITKTIVLLHYGIIKCESVLGEGTTFTVRIPLKHVEGAE